jgi:coenzyme Q-binding protein COQ10
MMTMSRRQSKRARATVMMMTTVGRRGRRAMMAAAARGEARAAWASSSARCGAPQSQHQHHRRRHRELTTTSTEDAASSSSSSSSTRFSARRIVRGITRRALYDVVRDVGKYHEFVPFCKGSAVTPRDAWTERARAEDAESSGREYFEAELEIGFTMFREKYTSAVTCEAPRMVEARSVRSGLFEKMTTTWRFTPLDGEDDDDDDDDDGGGMSSTQTTTTTKGDIAPLDIDGGVIVDFEIDFQVRDPMHAAAVRVVFDDVAKSQIQAFEKRCKHLALTAARK